jgi:O-antigen/teichoic acid export membrane protein
VHNLVTDSLWTFFSRGSSSASGLIISILLARTLGPESFGTYVYVILVISTASFFVNPGIYAAANYFLSTNRQTHFIIFTISFCVSIPFAILAGGGVAYWFTYTVSGSEIPMSHALFFGVIITTALTVIQLSMNGVVVGIGRIKAISKWLSILSVLHAGIITIFWIRNELDFQVSIGIYCLIHILTAGANLLLAIPGKLDSIAISNQEIKEYISHGLSVYSDASCGFLPSELTRIWFC